MKKKIHILILATLAMLIGGRVQVGARETNNILETPQYTLSVTNKETNEVINIAQDCIETREEHMLLGDTQMILSANISIPNEKGNMTRNTITDGGVTTRVTFNINYSKSGNLYKITGYSGKFEQLDKSFTISNRKVLVANFQNNETKKYIREHIPGNTFSYSGFSNWVDITYPNSLVAGYAKCDVSRQASSWELRLNYRIAANVIDIGYW
ncbi:MAG TPA: hypothetical protein DFH32_01775 [Lachnospiraceae bacterium]|jgi:hypothetical protein|nr:MAG: hypothetical protein BHW30_08045 [Firmicutes bacterium CAG_194_44_15]HCI17329.1 hypothetical protein [Lachnospiraceae bacterium]HCX42254.1 hypothetical protein [Lachnospiraceae bacterium]